MLKLERESLKLSRVKVSALVLSPDGELLLIKSREGDYFFPSGVAYAEESLEEAMLREIAELTNLSLENLQPLFYEEADSDYEVEGILHFYFLAYLNSHDEKGRIILNEKADEYLFEELEEVAILPIEASSQRILELYRKSTRSELSIGFKELSIDCLVGQEPDEKHLPQEIFIDLEMIPRKERVSTKELAALCKEVASSSHHLLLEDLGRKIVNLIFKNYHPKSVEICIRCPLHVSGSNGSFIKIKKEG